MNEAEAPVDPVRAVAELTSSYLNAEAITGYDEVSKRWKTKIRTVRHPALLAQLRSALVPGPATDGGGGGYESRMPVAAGALYALSRIETGTRRCINRWDLDERATLEANLRLLLGELSNRCPHPTRDGCESDACHGPTVRKHLRSSHTVAQIVVSWRSGPVFLSRVPCPACEKASLVAAKDGSRAWCQGCDETWDKHEVALLGEYVQWWLDTNPTRKEAAS